MKIIDIAVPDPGAGPEAFEEALRAADWSAFDPGRDLEPLRAALAGLERAHGVTAAHRYATGRILERGALLRHPDVHRVEVTAQALSPSGRYLAVGDFGGDDYEAGATLQIWEVTTGRCVNVIDGIVGGIGWPGYGETLEWSADETRLAVVYMSSNVGVWDPFGDDVEPIATVRLTYSGRPDPFALSPDGLRAYVVDEDSPTAASIVSLADGRVQRGDAEPIPVQDEEDGGEEDEDEEGNGFVLTRPVWSRDGARLYGNLHDGQVCSIDVASGRVAWLAEGAWNSRWPSAEWSRDETVVAYHADRRLIIADALTGRPVAELTGYRDVSFQYLYMSWGARLAVVVPESGDSDRPRVGIVDRTGEHLYDLDLAVRLPAYDLDVRSWAWEPDGDRAACLTAEGRIEIWSLGRERGERLRAFDAPEKASGVLWGADGVLVALGTKALRFLRADTGEVIGDFTLLRQARAPRPLELEGEDLGEEFGYSMEPEPNPTFALDDETWAVAFPPGLVIAPSGRDDELAAALAWSVDRRYAWPVHWGELEVVPDASAAERMADSLQDELLGEFLDPFHDRTLPEPGPQAWPPPNTATVDDLFQAFLQAVVEYANDRNPWSGEVLHEAALIRARRGEPEGANRLIEACPEHRRARLAAEAALLLAGSAGLPDDARSLISRYAADIGRIWGEPARVAAAVGGAYAALGDDERADPWFERARAALRKSECSWDHRLPVVWALLECGREDEAQALLDEGTGDPGHVVGVPFVGYALRKGRPDLAERILGPARNWFGDWRVVELLRRHGQTRLMHEWAERNNLAIQEPLGPGAEALAQGYEKLARTPPAKRKSPTVGLILHAAVYGHISAILDLLPGVPMPSPGGIMSSDRPYAAFSALRIVTTGIDAETW
ncbi:hypothetical protein GCM10010191_71600 [Actinomadura vinacea]|uniref:WD40 repeat domain-containing protein n=1 Tax=Actinomadura vinacea TaxID=115336 RepID=A0ABN3K0B9_9ACTN